MGGAAVSKGRQLAALAALAAALLTTLAILIQLVLLPALLTTHFDASVERSVVDNGAAQRGGRQRENNILCCESEDSRKVHKTLQSCGGRFSTPCGMR